MYEFSLGSMFWGLMILIAGAVFMRFHQWLADNFGSGVASYDRFKLVALLTCVLGILVMLSLHTLFFNWVFSLFFR